MRCLLLLLILLTGCKTKTKEVKESPFPNPQYPQTKQISYDTSSAKGNYKRGRKGYGFCINTVSEFKSRSRDTLHKEFQPFYHYQLGLNLLRTNHYGAAYKELSKVLALPDSTPFADNLKRLESLGELQEISRALTLRALARGGYSRTYAEVAKGYSPQFDDARLHYAYSLMLLGDTAATVKACEAALDTSCFRRLQKRSSVTAGVAHILYSLNQKEKLMELTQWMVDLGPLPSDGTYMKLNNRGERDEYYVNQWESSYHIVQSFRTLCQSPFPSLSKTKDGVFSGTVRSFIDSLTVEITFEKGKLTDCKVIKDNDDRPFSTMTVVPQRILKAQSLEVDAVTEATISSTAVVAATAKALQKAQN